MARRVSLPAITAFLLALALCFLLVFVMVLNRIQVERLTMEHLISESSVRINAAMSRLLFRVHTLSYYIVYNSGQIADFPKLAAMLIDDPSILNMLIAPDGVVSEVFPMEGNEAVLGLDFFSEGAGNREALMAKRARELVLGGPFLGVQGGSIMVGRLPVFLYGPDGGEYFWGFASVTLDYPAALHSVGLGDLAVMGFDYEIWRRNPDDDEMQLIASSDHGHRASTRYVEMPIYVMNANWYFRILALRSWYEFPETWISVLVSIIVSFMGAVVVQRNRDLRRLKDRLAVLSNTDPLTGIHNRRYFMDSVPAQADRVSRQNSESFLIIMDLDNFKTINDRYGHQSGDMVLKEVALRVAAVLRPYDLFARLGGEEFVLFVADMDRDSAVRLAERIRINVSETPIDVTGASLTVTVSLGVARAVPTNQLDGAMACADKAMYMAKSAGRNRVVFYDTPG